MKVSIFAVRILGNSSLIYGIYKLKKNFKKVFVRLKIVCKFASA